MCWHLCIIAAAAIVRCSASWHNSSRSPWAQTQASTSTNTRLLREAPAKIYEPNSQRMRVSIFNAKRMHCVLRAACCYSIDIPNNTDMCCMRQPSAFSNALPLTCTTNL
ncbi:hypothetical protein GQ54DRAFT_297668, partial [Martensiomyces pterosporus]